MLCDAIISIYTGSGCSRHTVARFWPEFVMHVTHSILNAETLEMHPAVHRDGQRAWPTIWTSLNCRYGAAGISSQY